MPQKNLFSDAFQTLDSTLHQHRNLWQHQPFLNHQTAWQHQHPALFDALLKLSHQESENLATNNQLRHQWFEAFIPTITSPLAQHQTLLQVAEPSTDNQQLFNAFEQVGIPGRKWQQITAFSNALPTIKTPIIDWCAGKGHLSRILHKQHQQDIYCLEFDQTLCDSGKLLAQKHAIDLQFIHHNVLDPLPKSITGSRFAHVGLHACGELHMQLLRSATTQSAEHIAIAPCCYHKVLHDSYKPLSAQARKAQLKLTQKDLHLPQEETITAGNRIKQLRFKEQQWRLAFNHIQQHVTGNQHYLPTPSIGKAIFSSSFKEFCQWAAAQRQLLLPLELDFSLYLEKGRESLETIRKLELVRQLFKRPLELWLILDRILFLEEQGYTVSLLEFCPQTITPRNLMIIANNKQTY